MGVLTIERVVRGEENGGAVTAPAGASASRTALNSASTSSATSSTGSRNAGGGSSAAYRIGFYQERALSEDQQEVVNTIQGRTKDDLTSDNEFYAVPFTDQGDIDTVLAGRCEDLRVRGFMAPVLTWSNGSHKNWIPYVGVLNHTNFDATFSLVVVDCGGDLIFATSKKKRSELRNNDWQSLLVSMNDDLVDQAERDFSTFRSAHTAEWANFLKTGLFLDPADTKTHALWSPLPDKEKNVKVYGLYPGGPAEVAGIKKGDIIVSIDGKPVSGMNPEQIQAMAHQGPFTVVVKRPEGDVTLHVVPLPYAQLMQLTLH